jgi:hypothetical protein
MTQAKEAFPNYSDYTPIGPTYDLGKWMGAMKDIYVKMHLGASKNECVGEITKEWAPMERKDFLEWLKYYESGDFKKYKRAQHSYYVNDDINYFIPNPPNPKPIAPNPIATLNDPMGRVSPVPVVQKQETSQEEKRKFIEDQRRKILGRLNSAEKLLSSHQGQIFAGPDFERLLSAIYELKKQIQTVNKINLSAQTCIDLIVRQANILNRQGFNNASDFMVKLAQNTPGDFSFNLGETPAGGSQPQAGGSLGNNTPPAEDLIIPPPDMNTDKSSGKGMSEFLENMEGAGFNKDDDSKAEDDESNAKDEIDMGDDDVLMDQEIIPDDKTLTVEAQAMPERAPAPETPMAMPTDALPAEAPAAVPEAGNLEVESPAPSGEADATGMIPEQAQKGPAVDQAKSDFDALIDSAFSNLTVADIVAKLESINKIFRNREISRQLAIVDVMLDRLGLASYFPTLAEATNKQLEANQYCLTRIEDILSRLRGTIQTKEIDLEGENAPANPQAAQVKETLEQADNKEKARKEMKKQIDEKQMFEQSKPQGEVEGVPQELAAQPTEVEAPTPAPAPAAAPAPIR